MGHWYLAQLLWPLRHLGTGDDWHIFCWMLWFSVFVALPLFIITSFGPSAAQAYLRRRQRLREGRRFARAVWEVERQIKRGERAALRKALGG